MGQPALPQFAGQSLVPELFGAAAEERHPLLLELVEDSHNPGLVAVIDAGYKLIVRRAGGSPRLFNLEKDPGELDNLAKREPARLAQMMTLLEQAQQGLPRIEPHGGMKLQSGRRARGPVAPAPR